MVDILLIPFCCYSYQEDTPNTRHCRYHSDNDPDHMMYSWYIAPCYNIYYITATLSISSLSGKDHVTRFAMVHLFISTRQPWQQVLLAAMATGITSKHLSLAFWGLSYVQLPWWFLQWSGWPSDQPTPPPGNSTVSWCCTNIPIITSNTMKYWNMKL